VSSHDAADAAREARGRPGHGLLVRKVCRDEPAGGGFWLPLDLFGAAEGADACTPGLQGPVQHRPPEERRLPHSGHPASPAHVLATVTSTSTGTGSIIGAMPSIIACLSQAAAGWACASSASTTISSWTAMTGNDPGTC